MNSTNYSKGYIKKHRNNNYYQHRNYQKEDLFIKRIDKVMKTDEEGFTGPTSSWFSNEEFYKKLQGKSDIEHQKDYYFHSYSSFYIHEQMLSDKVRTESYRKAIMNNPASFKDKVVLDIGCGTGILSIFAAQAGAKKVYGIEFADIADYAVQIVKENNLSDKVTIIKSKVEEANLPEKVDIIISEWMGYFLLYESMLDTVLYARDTWLAPGGKILPDKASIHLAAIEDGEYKKSKLNFWDSVYNIDMSCIKGNVIKDPIVDSVNKDAIISNSCKILEIDLNTVKKEDLDFSSAYQLTFIDNTICHGIIAWFDIEFGNLPNRVTFGTSPFDKWTHWKQVVFYSRVNLRVERGDVLKGSIAVRKSETNFRELDIKMSYHIYNRTEKEDWNQLYKLK